MWTYNNLRITVTGIRGGGEQLIAELQPVNSSTVYQIFGWTKDRLTVQALVVGADDLATLEAMLDDGVAYSLALDGVSLGDFYPKKLDKTWKHTYRQTFRPDKSPTDRVYEVNLELLKST